MYVSAVRFSSRNLQVGTARSLNPFCNVYLFRFVGRHSELHVVTISIQN